MNLSDFDLGRHFGLRSVTFNSVAFISPVSWSNPSEDSFSPFVTFVSVLLVGEPCEVEPDLFLSFNQPSFPIGQSIIDGRLPWEPWELFLRSLKNLPDLVLSLNVDFTGISQP